MSVLRDIFRRRLRSLLTISGVAVGVFALVVLGAFVEKSSVQVGVLEEYTEGTINVVDDKAVGFAGFSDGTRPLLAEKIAAVAEVPGVDTASPVVGLLMDDSSAIMWTPTMILAGTLETLSKQPEMAEGRLFTEDEQGVTVLGSDLAAQLDARVGDEVDLRGEQFEVVGIMERTLISVTDQAANITRSDARALYVASLPKAFQSRIREENVNTHATLAVDPGEDGDAIAARINREVDGVLATGPTEQRKQVTDMLAMLNLVIGSVGAVALLVGGLTVVNTMLVAVAERTHEIGAKRALGASAGRVARDVLVESVTIAFLGGLFGMAGGALVITAMNGAVTAQTGMGLFLVTWRLAAGAMLFAVVLGTLAGLYPAWYTARIDPVQALASR